MKAEIIAVGTELLVGDIVNTNAQFIARELFSLGIDVFYQTVVGDNPKRLTEAIEHAFSRADLVIFSGGLGPTEDDLTKETVSAYFGVPLLFHEEIWTQIRTYLKDACPESNRKQACIPQGGRILSNYCGTAPGVIVEQGDKIAILLPGPPRELMPMFTKQVIPYLEEKSAFVMRSKILRLFGIGEARVGEELADLMACANPTVAPYAKDYEVILRIAAKAENGDAADVMIEQMEQKIRNRIGEYVYGYGEETMAKTTGMLLLSKGLTVACAESCTAGLLTGALGDIPGISAVLQESIVTYSNEAKIKYLGVSPDTLRTYGAVSRETAEEMARGIQAKTGAHIGISVTGIAGPDGGTAEKPVGLVYVGVCYQDCVTIRALQLKGDRLQVRQSAVMHALDEVRCRILAQEG
ncbi:MAG: competence/damage-inducible protein A [Ruminococcaceae bacterium]|nr:competence/damage-inducible protein A [Oscillospiraceae bacterium]